ncbi:carboxypeptidase regulatory-like domain-containing protein [Flavobacterium granuli]|uniref:Tol biopolymer transport system component n=1 Tax=Flavobacterium granuli TaxID=280093 RepID=A0ABU1RY59_9FLAO|nr:carboxypeptidase regulatory-like domain-containing protein [Flavobacterium granuli]MDR6843696.1 Tol biopolymer transport system component [Flavobacterium granuli]
MEKLRIGILMCLIILFSCSEEKITDGGTGTVKGRVVDAVTFAPIENAKVSSNPSTDTYFTDKDGYFTFEGITIGKYTFEARKDKYVAKFEAATVKLNETTQIIFELKVSTADNRPPDVPVLTSPADLAKNQAINLQLTWTATDIDKDSLTYVVTVKNGTTDEITTYKDLKTRSLDLKDLKYSTKYYWQVASSDGINIPVNSLVSSFTTLPFPNPRFLYIKKVNNNNVIYTADEAGNELQLTSSSINSYRPRKNLQSNKIAYISSDGSQNQIYMMNLDGSNIKKITNTVPIAGFNMENINFCWSTNGSQILYPNFDKLYRINSDGGGLIEIFKTPNGKFISECDWNQSANQIVLKVNDISGYNVEIYVIKGNGQVLYNVLSGQTGAVSGLNMSFDTQKIVFTRDVSGNENSTYRRFDSRIFIYDRVANTITQLNTTKDNGFNDLDAKFSPNEAEIIFTNTSNDGISVKNVYKTSVTNTGTGTTGSARTLLFSGGSMPEWK